MKKQKGVLISVNDKDLKLLEDNTTFKNFKRKFFWKNIETIGSNSFSNCAFLEKIELPLSIKEIDERAFQKSKIKEIKLNSTLLAIGKNAFSNCKNLKEIEVPGSVHTIGDRCFFESGVKKVKLNFGTNLIGSYAFSECKNLKEIEIPPTVITISNNAFENSALEKISFNNIHNLLTNIEEKAFYNCKNLKEIEIPGSVQIIEDYTFSGSGTRRVILNEGIKKIGYGAFSDCENLNEVIMPNSITRIQEKIFYNSGVREVKLSDKIEIIEDLCFANCKNLKEIEIPSSVYSIGQGTFMNSGLERIKLNDQLYEIKPEAFNNCKNLESIVFPESLEKIKDRAFANSGLRSVIFNDNLKVIDNGAFENCKNIKYIELPTRILKIGINAFKNCDFNYLYKIEKGNWILSSTRLSRNDIVSEYKVSDLDDLYTSILTRSDYKTIFNRLYEYNKNNVIITNECIDNYLLFEALFFKNNTDFFKKTFKKMNFDKTEEKEILSFMKLLYSLGAFENDKITRQRACNFIENEVEKGILNKEKIKDIFEGAFLYKYDKEWAELLLDKKNFHELLNNTDSYFIAHIYNNFSDIKEFNRSNKGNQHYLKVTLNVCERFFKFGKFERVDETNEDIAVTLKKFTIKQKSFDEASKIRREYLKLKEEGKISDNLLSKELVEKDVFESIESLKQEIIFDTQETLNRLDEFSNKKFTYEFLSKYDPRNFVLGKYCSCCAHIEGVGYGVMKASIINPNCQNLVIKDKSGNIIAKSTLYINKRQGYGVFNNVEINENITRSEDKKMIYRKYKQAIVDFANEYNKENDVKLTQINVGMGRNDLEEIIETKDEEGKRLKAINFSNYSKNYFTSSIYEGDWQKKQYVIWKKGK